MFSQLNRLLAQKPAVSRFSDVYPTESSHQKHSEWIGQMENVAKSRFRAGFEFAAAPQPPKVRGLSILFQWLWPGYRQSTCSAAFEVRSHRWQQALQSLACSSLPV